MMAKYYIGKTSGGGKILVKSDGKQTIVTPNVDLKEVSMIEYYLVKWFGVWM